MAKLIQQSTANDPLFFFLVLTSDHISPATGLSPTVTLSKNGAAFASPSGAVTEIANGWYQVAGNATDTGTLGDLLLHASVATADNCDLVAAQVVAFNPRNANLGLSNVSANVAQWNGTNVAVPATAGIPDVNVKNMNNVSGASITTINANQGTTQPINFTGTAGSALVKTDMIDISSAAVSTSTAQLGVNVVNWGATAVPQPPPGSEFIRQGTAQAGGASTITLDAGASATTNLYNGETIFITGGTGVGQSNIITAYNGATKVATVGTAWATQPTSSSTFIISAYGPVQASVSGTVNANVTQWNGTAVVAPATAGIPDINVKNIANVAAALDANNLLKVDTEDWKGTAVSVPATAGVPDINAKNINNVSTASVATINANQGTTQPINFTGVGGAALVKGDMTDIAGVAVSTTTAQIGTNAVQINGVATTPVTTINANQGTTQPVNFTGTAGSALVKGDMTDIAGAAVNPALAQVGANAVQLNGISTTGITTISANVGTAQPINFTGTGASALVQDDVRDINGVALAAQALAQSTQEIIWGTCSGGTLTTAIILTLNNPSSLTASGQLIGRTIVFLGNTTTAGLRGQASNITGSTTGATPTLTYTAMTNAPTGGDVFVVI